MFTRVGIRQFRAELRRWLDRVQQGEEIIVTEHGKPVARLVSMAQDPRIDKIQQAIAAGLITPARRPKTPAKDLPRIPVRGSVSDFVIEDRGW